MSAAHTAPVRVTPAKGVWGPADAASTPVLATAAQLGAGTYLTTLRWADVATDRPAAPQDPADPAYAWPEGLDATLADAATRGMRVTVNLSTAPAWASGIAGTVIAPPRRPQDFAAFAEAASRRYPSVSAWQIWSEPTKPTNWLGLPPATRPSRPLTGAARRAPRLYAQLLDAAYGALHAVDPADTVIGGNTWTAGRISPYQWIRAMRLPNGRAPRMDQYGHNPFSSRAADLSQPAITPGTADICDLDDLMRWLDRFQRRPGRRPLPVNLTEFTIPSGGPSYDFNFYVSEDTAARWTRAALRLVRRHPRIRGIAWVTVADTRTPEGTATTGLLRTDGSRKPAFDAFAAG